MKKVLLGLLVFSMVVIFSPSVSNAAEVKVKANDDITTGTGVDIIGNCKTNFGSVHQFFQPNTNVINSVEVYLKNIDSGAQMLMNIVDENGASRGSVWKNVSDQDGENRWIKFDLNPGKINVVAEKTYSIYLKSCQAGTELDDNSTTWARNGAGKQGYFYRIYAYEAETSEGSLSTVGEQDTLEEEVQNNEAVEEKESNQNDSVSSSENNSLVKDVFYGKYAVYTMVVMLLGLAGLIALLFYLKGRSAGKEQEVKDIKPKE